MKNLENKLTKIVKILTQKNQTISTMESCTGGALVNAITNIKGASEIIKYSAITYSNEFKIKMGVSTQTIQTHSVYSKQVAREMAKNISTFTNSTYGIGITGQLKTKDQNNPSPANDQVFITIYNSQNQTYIDKKLTITKETRIENKNQIIENTIDMLMEIIKKL